MKIALKTVDGHTYTGILVEINQETIIVKEVYCDTKPVNWIPHLDGSAHNTRVQGEIKFIKKNVILYYTLD